MRIIANGSHAPASGGLKIFQQLDCDAIELWTATQSTHDGVGADLQSLHRCFRRPAGQSTDVTRSLDVGNRRAGWRGGERVPGRTGSEAARGGRGRCAVGVLVPIRPEVLQ